MRQKKGQLNEEEIGTKGQGSVSCRVQADGSTRRYSTRCAVKSCPGTKIRVSIGVENHTARVIGKVARMLAFVDPLTGRLVVRMGMFDVGRSTKGHEIGPQVVWESDVPVCKIDND